ncbi:hypothetical protein [Silvanigrella aquatica]|uniref:Uncharacterized protein n=1 Tax=Silvanigrella aquatica TaxID=1915309 RepID=A0A1L4CY48_9BACT|nr:hypothetical protein [Silvanigrella aquatica]APJ02864.1 hypothetical protein AXG55_02580 [Silvanigrella aquatica]
MRIIYSLISFIIIIFVNPVFCLSETYVFCADKKRNWKWLNTKNNKISGEWGIFSTNSKYGHYYFIPEDGIHKIRELKMACINEFGQEFIYPQPSDSYARYWAVFAIDKSHLIPGHYTLFSYNSN